MTNKVPLTKEQIENLPELEITVAELKEKLTSNFSRSLQLQERWILGLAVANGGALTALSAKLIDLLAKAPDQTALTLVGTVFPSLVLFVVGFVSVGVAAIQEMTTVQGQAARAHNSLRVRQGYPGSVTHDQQTPPTLLQWAPEIVSGLAFSGGLSYPLIVLAKRYLEHGYFIW